jgi:GT2 family glycosyltransferase
MTPPAAARLLVVIVNYRTPQQTIDCLRSLEPEVRALGGVTVVVTDNHSQDDSVERIRDALATNGWDDWAALMPLDKNGGFAFGNNAAIRPALASANPPPPDYVLLLNPDTVAFPDALGELLRFMDAHPEVGIAGSRLQVPDGSHQPSRFRFHSVWSELNSGLRLGVVSRLLRNYVVAAALVEADDVRDWVAGASMIVRRQVFLDVGLFDQDYFLYYEEADFCLNARRRNWPCWYVNGSRVMHIAGCSTGVTGASAPALRRPRYWFASRRRYFVKNHGRLYALCADLAWVSGFALWRIRRILQRKPDSDPPHLLWDFLRFGMSPGRREQPASGAGTIRQG